MDWSTALAIVALGASWGVWAWAWTRFRALPDYVEVEEAVESARRTKVEMADLVDRFDRLARRWGKRESRGNGDTAAEAPPDLLARAAKFRDPRKRARVLEGLTKGDE